MPYHSRFHLVSPTANFLPRPRVMALLDAAPVPPLILITAPAGYGKSTVAAQWTEARPQETAWLSLTIEHNAPARLLQDLLAALGGAGEGDDVTLELVLTRSAEMAARSPGSAIVLDDCHVLESSDVHQTLSALASRLPAGLHLVLVSRTMPPIPLARRRLNDEVREIDQQDLSFTRDEVAKIVDLFCRQRLPDAALEALSHRTDGWIAGIRMAISALDVAATQRQPDSVEWAVATWIDDYITEEVLGALPGDIREFVLRTALLPYLDPLLCDDVLGITNSARMLEQVRNRLVFVRPGGPEDRALAYHALFAESAARIAAATWPRPELLDLHRRAARWFRQRGQVALAAEQALNGEAWDLATEIIRDLCRPLIDSDHSHSAWYWLRKLPEENLLNDPEMARWYISTLQHLGYHQPAEEAYAMAHVRWQASGDPAHQAYDLLCQTLSLAMNGHTECALRTAYEAIEIAPDHLSIDLMHAWTYVYQIESSRGHDDRADNAYREAERHRRRLPVDQWYWFSNTELHRINTEAVRGRLRGAEQMYTHKLENSTQFQLFLDGKIRYRRSAIWLEWNELSRVQAGLDDIRQQAAVQPYRIWHQEALMHVAEAEGAIGDLDGMEATLRQVREMFHERGGRHNLNRLEALEVDLWLATGRLPLAQDWLRRTSHEAYPPPLLFGDPDPRLARVKIAIASGEPDLALRTLAQMIDDATTRRCWAELVSLATWQMVGHLHRSDEPAALASLALALQYGRPEGFVRSFMAEAPGVISLLRTAPGHLPADDARYVRYLQDQGVWEETVDTGKASRVGELLPDPISPREQEVLQLLPGGLTNREIGERLFITERTVKKHVGSILAKLDVANRQAAVTRARQLGLLDGNGG